MTLFIYFIFDHSTCPVSLVMVISKSFPFSVIHPKDNLERTLKGYFILLLYSTRLRISSL